MASIYDKASLVLIPSGTKTSKVYSQVPTNGDGDFTFSRSTAATRVNASGNIEKETQNLLKYSNTLSNADWVKTNTSVTGGQSGYDGSSDAWLLDITGGTDSQRLEQSVSLSGVQTFSIYAKAGTEDWIRLRVNTSGITAQSYFDLANGALGVTQSGLIDRKIEDVGGGWYRCSISYNETSSLVRIYPALGNGVVVGGTGNIYIQDAQLEQGLVARDYIETTTTAIYGGITDNVPRLDYQGSCPALLLEPQRTNLVPYSEYFGTSDWVKLGVGTGSTPVITHNYAESPEGLNNATRIQLNLNGGTSSGDQSLIYDDLGAKTGDHTRSVYIKSNSGNVDLYFGGTLNDKKTITATTEWQRFDFTSSLSAQTLYVTIGLRGTTGSSDTADILVWGFQAEAGSYATSYIPTYGSAVTRNQDNTLNSSAASIIGQTEGSIYAEVDFKAISEESRFVQLSDGTNSNRFLVGSTSSNGVQIYVVSGGAVQWTPATTPFSDGVIKVAVAYKNNDYAMYVNGTQINTTTNASVPAMDEISIGYNSIVGNRPTAYGHRKVMLFPTRLSNEELATLTTI